MKAIIRTGFALAAMIAAPVFSQVQLFEQDLSGLVPYVGLKWNQNVTEMGLGVEYSIEGRTTLGFAGNLPLADTLKWENSYTADKPKAYVLNPYAIFEFFEPGNLSTFSFAIRTDMYWEDLRKADDNRNDFSRMLIGGGPVFASRIWTSDRFAVIPTAYYEFFYTRWRKTILLAPPPGQVVNKSNSTNGDGIAHDISLSCAFYYKFSETLGFSFEPKGLFKLGEGRNDKDLVNIQSQFSLVWTM